MDTHMGDASAAVAAWQSGQAQGQWTLDPAHTTVEFAVKHFWHLITVRGRFDQVEGTGTVAPDGSVSGQLTIQAASVNTKNKRRDTHLRSADFFDAEQHPHVVLTVTEAVPADGEQLTAKGTLEAAGRSQPVSFTARAEQAGPDAVTLRAETVVDRSTFGMGWSPLSMTAMEATGTVTARFIRA
jgi:polyisoprenoid-binding protein YceI